MYQTSRPNIPEVIRREVEVEAGHECSVVGCPEHTYLEIHHINQNRDDNRKENLILLCDKHHKMAHAKVIDRKALQSYKQILNARATGNAYSRGLEGDRVLRFLDAIRSVLSYLDDSGWSYADSETGYWFEQQVYLNLSAFFQNIQSYNLELRSYDSSARDRQDRIVDLLRQILDVRSDKRYVYNGGYCANFVPASALGTAAYDIEIKRQIENVALKLQAIEALVKELWDYAEYRPA
jgi:hypothetical protein